MDDLDLLRRLCINDADVTDAGHLWRASIDPLTRAMVQLAALVSVNAVEPSIHSATDDAIAAGATTRQLIALLDGLVPVVGLPRVVAAAPRLAMALGYDADQLFDDDLH